MTANTIDLSPLIPVVNDLIQYVLVPVAYAAVPIVSGFIIRLLVQYGALKTQQQAAIVGQRIGGLMDTFITYDAEKLNAIVPQKLVVAAPNEKIATIANYAIAQIPDLLTKANMDPTTKAGQESIVRVITAKIGAAPSAKPDLTVKVSNSAPLN